MWPDPERFDPERFLGERGAAVETYTHLPFITGPHKCLGHQFAKTQMKVVVASLLQRFRFTKPKGAEYKKYIRITLQPKPPVTLIVTNV